MFAQAAEHVSWLSVQIAEHCALIAGIRENGSAEIAQGLNGGM